MKSDAGADDVRNNRCGAHPQVTTLTYFALKAAIFPAVCVMEVGGVEYQGKPVTLGPFSNDLCVAETW